MASGVDIEKLFNRYLSCQDTLFATLNSLARDCRSDIEAARSENERGMLKSIHASIIRFETQFGMLEAYFWSYWEEEANVEYYKDIASSRGYDSFIEFLMGELGKCHTWIDDITTEIAASGYEWSTAAELPDQFWALMDAAEELYEVSPSEVPHDELLDVLSRIPPQRFAPIQIELIDNQFALRHTNVGLFRVNVKSMKIAFNAVRREISEALSELQITNCDRRFINYYARLNETLDRDFDSIEAIEIGVNVVIVENTLGSVKDELADAVFGRIVGSILNVKQFIANFRDWTEYSDVSLPLAEDDTPLVAARRIEQSLSDPIFSDEVKDKAAYYSDMSKHVEENSLRSGFVMGMQNIIIAVSREVLKYIRLASDKAVSKFGAIIGTAAAAWVMAHMEAILAFAQSHASFSWIKAVMEFISRHIG